MAMFKGLTSPPVDSNLTYLLTGVAAGGAPPVRMYGLEAFSGMPIMLLFVARCF